MWWVSRDIFMFAPRLESYDDKTFRNGQQRQNSTL